MREQEMNRADAVKAVAEIIGSAAADLTVAAAEDEGLYSDDSIYISHGLGGYYVADAKTGLSADPQDR